MKNEILIRPVMQSDAAELLDIYKPYILHTSLTPEFEVPTVDAFRERIDRITAFYPFLVCLQENKIAGYAYAHQYRPAAGHQWSVEATVYFSQQYHGKGLSGILYETLLSILKLQNFINVYAGIILPNDPSVAFHKKFHFKDVGTFKHGIYKSGAWHDVRWMQLALKSHKIDPPLPRPRNEIIHTEEYDKIMKIANRG